MKLFFLLPGLLVSFTAVCQVRIGLSAGPVYSAISLKTEERSDILISTSLGGDVNGDRKGRTGGLVGYSAGWVIDARLAEGFSIRMELRYTQKGWKDDVHYTEEKSGSSGTTIVRSYDYRETFKLSYLNVPLYILFSPPVGQRRLLIGIGPAIGFAISGKYLFHVLQTTDPTIRDSADMIGIYSYQRKRAALNASNIDLGISVIAGMEFRNGTFFHIGFNPGMRNVMLDRYSPFVNRYVNITAAIGLFLGKL